MRYDDNRPTVPDAGRHARSDDEPTVRVDAPAAAPTVPLGFDQTMPLTPQDHSVSTTVAAAMPKRLPRPRPTELVRPESGPQSPITLRIGRGVVAVERSRQVRSAAERAGAHAWRIGNIVLTVAILAAASWAGWQWWQRWHSQLGVEHVTIAVVPPPDQCNAEFDLVGTISSNGKAGRITYQWLRSDGETTKRLTVNVPAGQRTTTVHLYWTFSGFGSQSASATLKLIDPDEAEAVGQFSYDCLNR